MSMPGSAATGVSVAVIDDHDTIHAGIQAWCAIADPPVRVVGSYFSVDQFFADPCDAEVVLLDLELTSRRPDFSGIERVIESSRPVVIYSHIIHDEVILKCLDLGATTYVAKSEGKAHLLAAIRAAATDTAYVSPRMAGAISNDRRVGRPRLTSREHEILVAWFQTESKELVAERLYISPSTVRPYLQRVRIRYAPVGRPAPTKAALVARAVQDGIISVEEL